MTIYLDDEEKFFEDNKELYDTIRLVIDKCLDKESVPYEVEISLSVVSLEEIHDINNAHRKVDRPTDVLSFPQLEGDKVGEINWDNIDLSGSINYDTDEVVLGDIILCPDRAKEQAVEYGHSLDREICFLIAHSMFHLLGYDHMNEVDEKIMMAKQEEVLKELNILR